MLSCSIVQDIQLRVLIYLFISGGFFFFQGGEGVPSFSFFFVVSAHACSCVVMGFLLHLEPCGDWTSRAPKPHDRIHLEICIYSHRPRAAIRCDKQAEIGLGHRVLYTQLAFTAGCR